MKSEESELASLCRDAVPHNMNTQHNITFKRVLQFCNECDYTRALFVHNQLNLSKHALYMPAKTYIVVRVCTKRIVFWPERKHI